MDNAFSIALDFVTSDDMEFVAVHLAAELYMIKRGEPMDGHQAIDHVEEDDVKALRSLVRVLDSEGLDNLVTKMARQVAALRE